MDLRRSQSWLLERKGADGDWTRYGWKMSVGNEPRSLECHSAVGSYGLFLWWSIIIDYYGRLLHALNYSFRDWLPVYFQMWMYVPCMRICMFKLSMFHHAADLWWETPMMKLLDLEETKVNHRPFHDPFMPCYRAITWGAKFDHKIGGF